MKKMNIDIDKTGSGLHIQWIYLLHLTAQNGQINTAYAEELSSQMDQSLLQEHSQYNQKPIKFLGWWLQLELAYC